MSRGSPILDEDLQAYVDNRLGEERRREVEDYLRSHSGAAELVEAYSRQRRQLREALAPIAEEPIPPALNLRRMIESRPRREAAGWKFAAAVFLSLGLGSVGGWMARGASPPATEATGIAALSREAASSYSVFAVDRSRPVELGADRQAELESWVAHRLQEPVVVPDLKASGYNFIGGRVVATEHGPAGMFLYEDDSGNRVAMVMRRMAFERNAPMVEHASNGVGGFTWAEQGVGFSLVSDKYRELHPLADEMRRQLRQGLKS